jgi:hypothetical protein
MIQRVARFNCTRRTALQMTSIGEIERRLVKSKKTNLPWYGAIAQLGERIVRNDEVVGSIPTSSTNLLKDFATLAVTRAHIENPPYWTVMDRAAFNFSRLIFRRAGIRRFYSGAVPNRVI